MTVALYRAGAFVADDWCFPGEAPLPPTGRVAIGKPRFLAERASLLSREDAVGVVLEAGESLAGIAESLPRLGLVALRIARFTDGRCYSLARMLRDAHGYRGELRATGDILRDQVKLLLRAGFDALELGDPGTIAALREGLIVAVDRHYQPAARGVVEERAGGASWRRVSAAVATPADP